MDYLKKCANIANELVSFNVSPQFFSP